MFSGNLSLNIFYLELYFSFYLVDQIPLGPVNYPQGEDRAS